MSNGGTPKTSEPVALVFDVFGTVVDWRSSVVNELASFGRAHGIEGTDWARFADEWRAGYGSACRELSRGQGKWRIVDDIHRARLDELIKTFNIRGSFQDGDLAALNRVWHRLDGWPDSPSGLMRLKSKFTIATLSNGNFGLLVNMAKHAGLPWDAVLSADVVGAYKPNPRVYSTACTMLGLRNEQVMMVAAHRGDLDAAASLGLQTAFVHRPAEHGGGPEAPIPDFASDFNYAASDLNELADLLRCD